VELGSGAGLIRKTKCAGQSAFMKALQESVRKITRVKANILSRGDTAIGLTDRTLILFMGAGLIAELLCNLQFRTRTRVALSPLCICPVGLGLLECSIDSRGNDIASKHQLLLQLNVQSVIYLLVLSLYKWPSQHLIELMQREMLPLNTYPHIPLPTSPSKVVHIHVASMNLAKGLIRPVRWKNYSWTFLS